MAKVVVDVGTKSLQEQMITLLQTNVGHTADTGGTATSGTIFAKENAILEKLTSTEASLIVKTIRHIQRGIVGSGSFSSKAATVSLSGFTNTDKMIVLLNGDTAWNTNSGGNTTPYLAELTVDTLTIKTISSGNNCVMSYQVIEYY